MTNDPNFLHKFVACAYLPPAYDHIPMVSPHDYHPILMMMYTAQYDKTPGEQPTSGFISELRALPVSTCTISVPFAFALCASFIAVLSIIAPTSVTYHISY